jgi:seryl-tRNA synthetase
MLDARFVRENLDLVNAALENRGSDILLDEYVIKYDALKSTTQRLDLCRHEVKHISKGGKPTPQEIERAKVLNLEIKTLGRSQRELRAWLEDFLLNLPNIPHHSVPIGTSEKDNVTIKHWGQKPTFSSDKIGVEIE